MAPGFGVPPARISTIAAGDDGPDGVTATFPIEKIRDAVDLQAGFHVHGKCVITL